MDITSLQIECQVDGGVKVQAWCKCQSPDDIDDLIAWLGLARHVMTEWMAIRSDHLHFKSDNVRPIKNKKGAANENDE